MILRKYRWIAATVLAVAGVAAAPGRSSAATVILVEETGGSFSKTYNPTNLPASFDTGNYSNVKITINSSSESGPANGHSISTTLNAAPGSSFSTDIGLRVTVTDDGFINSNPGGSGTFTGNVSNTSAFVTSTAEGTATLSQPPTTRSATASTGTSSLFTPANVSGVPGQFSIQQILELRVSSLSNDNATFTAGISTQVDSSVAPVPAPVPAPPAILLALAAIPALGVRRALRRRS